MSYFVETNAGLAASFPAVCLLVTCLCCLCGSRRVCEAVFPANTLGRLSLVTAFLLDPTKNRNNIKVKSIFDEIHPKNVFIAQ